MVSPAEPIHFDPTVLITWAAWCVGLAAVFVGLRVAWLWWVSRRHRDYGTGCCVRIAVPPEVDARGGARWWSHAMGMARPDWKRRVWGQPHVVWEYAWSDSRAEVRVWTPDETTAKWVVSAVSAAWPGAVTTIEAAQAPVAVGAMATAGTLGMGGDTAALNSDQATEPLRGVLSAGMTHRTGESAIVQVYARPVAPWRLRRLRASADPSGQAASFGQIAWRMLAPGGDSGTTTHRTAGRVDAGVRERLRAPQWEVAVRYAAATTHVASLGAARKATRSRAAQIAMALNVFAGPGGMTRRRLWRANLINARQWRPHTGRIVTLDELAALAHVPADAALPQISRAGAKPVAPVPEVQSGGRGTVRLGTSTVTGRRVAIAPADMRHHVHLLGATGTGKSTLLANMALADIRARRGVVVVDPKGDLVDDILDRLRPDDVAGRLRLIDPRQPRHLGIDPLAGGDRDLTVDNFLSICRHLWSKHWGPRADDIMRAATLTVLGGKKKPSLAHVPALLLSQHERGPITANLTGQLGSFWRWYDAMPPGLQAQAIGPVVSRIRSLMLRQFVHDTIGAPSSDINMSDVLDGGVLLVRLPKGVIGSDSAHFIGSVIVSRVWQAATARAALPQHQRHDASLYVDEVQNFLALPQTLDEVLPEARGYKLAMVLAHQYLGQLPTDMHDALDTNARSKVVFSVSPKDARHLAGHTQPALGDHDLSRLEAFQAAARLFTQGREQPAFTMTTQPAAEPVGHSEEIRAAATPAPVADNTQEAQDDDENEGDVSPGV